MNTSDDRIYSTVIHPDHSLQYYATVLVTFLATPINFLSFYLILFKSKKEKTSFKISFFLTQFSFYIAQFHLGVTSGIVFLAPFPAIYSQGLLSKYLDAFSLCVLWVVLFCCFAFFCYLTLVIRLRIVARPGKTFDCQRSVYMFVYVILFIYVFIPLLVMMFYSYASKEEMLRFVREKFPKNMQVFDHEGVYVFAHLDMRVSVPLMAFMVLSGLILIITIYYFISVETRISPDNTSCRYVQANLKSLHNLQVQSTGYAIFLSIACGLMMKTFFNDPSEDPRVWNAFCQTVFCGASIPSLLMMISRNRVYREFALSLLNISPTPTENVSSLQRLSMIARSQL